MRTHYLQKIPAMYYIILQTETVMQVSMILKNVFIIDYKIINCDFLYSYFIEMRKWKHIMVNYSGYVLILIILLFYKLKKHI